MDLNKPFVTIIKLYNKQLKIRGVYIFIANYLSILYMASYKKKDDVHARKRKKKIITTRQNIIRRETTEQKDHFLRQSAITARINYKAYLSRNK